MHEIKDNAAYIIRRLNEVWGISPGKKTLQKIVFLIEQKGVGLNYDYGLHFYGPYSAALDAATEFLSADGIVNFDYSGRSHRMSIANDYAVLPKNLSVVQEEVIDDVITRFEGKSPSELELLTTAIYAYNNLEDKTRESVINGVLKIKGEKYNRAEIRQALDDFAYFDKHFQ